ncbi:poly(glycerol-phosphate) alpha-glucosyltransferase [Aquisalibacillus elongatus]|uniref:Poly(Glycerol-phosphate) alpha-glucosyltransferase n=2 Tax=Aquisalibacillus elongatus TaxID=485577 RepID=A0A3N5B9N3_9BACI|nr:poly(glycerol-phosphate) alpha-glucosyltransferase [Aquisalibacillus elongatus]
MNYVVTSTLPPTFGGRTKALLNRTRLLMENEDFDFTLISTNFKSNYQEIYDLYVNKHYVPQNVRFMNIYDFLRGNEEPKPTQKHPVEEEGYEVQKVSKKKNAYRYFKDGIYVMYKSYTHTGGQLNYIDYISPNSSVRIMRKDYDLKGYLYREIHYVPNSLNKTQEIMYTQSGSPFINRIYDGTDKNNIKHVVYFDGENSQFFKDESEFIKFCFEKMIESNSNVICDVRKLDQPLNEADIHNCQKIYLQHSTFHELNKPEKLRGSFKYLKEHAKEADRIVLLTEEQRKNWESVTGVTDNTVTIPHSISLTREPTETRDKNKFVIMGRLDGNKRINHAMKAFSLAAKKNKDIYLEVYGEGDLLDELKSFRDELSLHKRVVFKGRTDNPDQVFQSAQASLFTSKYEGFGLVVLESLVNGCPVISYDIKYGPNEMIEHDKSGFLVEPKNVEEMSEYILKAVDKKFDVQVDRKYSHESFVKQWAKLLQPNKKPFSQKLKALFNYS